MARKPKAPSGAGPPKPPKRKMTQAEQSELFVRTARELGVDESGEEFEKAFKAIISASKK